MDGLGELLRNIVVVAVSVALSWLVAHYIDERQERKSIRLLVAAEIIENTAALLLFGRMLATWSDIETKQRKYVAAHFGDLFGNNLGWRRERWNQVVVGKALTPDEVARISSWYINLNRLVELRDRVIIAGRMFEKRALLHLVFFDEGDMVEIIGALAKLTSELLESGIPFVEPDLSKPVPDYETQMRDMAKRLAALDQESVPGAR